MERRQEFEAKLTEGSPGTYTRFRSLLLRSWVDRAPDEIAWRHLQTGAGHLYLPNDFQNRSCSSCSVSAELSAIGPVSTVAKSEQRIPWSGVVSVVRKPMVPTEGKNGIVIGT